LIAAIVFANEDGVAEPVGDLRHSAAALDQAALGTNGLVLQARDRMHMDVIKRAVIGAAKALLIDSLYPPGFRGTDESPNALLRRSKILRNCVVGQAEVEALECAGLFQVRQDRREQRLLIERGGWRRCREISPLPGR